MSSPSLFSGGLSPAGALVICGIIIGVSAIFATVACLWHKRRRRRRAKEDAEIQQQRWVRIQENGQATYSSYPAVSYHQSTLVNDDKAYSNSRSFTQQSQPRSITESFTPLPDRAALKHTATREIGTQRYIPGGSAR